MRKKQIILRVILAVSIIAAVIFATALVRELYIDRQSRSYYLGMLAGIETRPCEPGYQETEEPVETGQPQQSDDPVNQWIPYVDFNTLNDTYPGIVAWIKLEGSMIDYPVMQYTDNVYFLSHLPDGTQHRNGSIFLDYRNNSDFSDRSILIYGHELRTQDMFAALKNYRDQEFFDANPILYLYTPQQDYTIVLFAGHLAHSGRDHPPLIFPDDEMFLSYIEELKKVSLFNSDVTVTADDTIVSLCTCAYDFDEARLVLTGILVEH